MRNPFVAPTVDQMFFRHSETTMSEKEFFPYIRLPNGTFKTTQEKRLSDIDELIVTILSQEVRHYDLLDVACSSGTCTAELAETLKHHSVDCSMYASDLFLYASQYRIPLVSILYCGDRHILQVDIAGCAFPNTPPCKVSRVLFWVALPLLNFIQRVGIKAKKVPLLSSIARRSLIRFSEGDVFGEIYQADPVIRFDIIRIANLLSTSYFTESEIKRALSNVKRYLQPDGLLVLLRTESNINYASIYKNKNGILELFKNHNGGGEIARLLTESIN